MKIQELEKRTGLDRPTIRYYEREGLLQPERLENGYRNYSENDLRELMKIKLFRMLNIPIEQIQYLQNGHSTIADTVTIRLNSINHESKVLRKTEIFCEELVNCKQSYRDFDPLSFLTINSVTIS